MTPEQLSEVLNEEMDKRGWNVSRLAREAELPFETTRRAVRAMGNVSLETTTKLLVAVGHQLAAVEVDRDEAPTV